jgi:DNA-directed RNA polymerase subunit RPC12/RpoP
MHCSNCGTENPNKAQYCSNCGEKLVYKDETLKEIKNTGIKEEKFSLKDVDWIIVLPAIPIMAIFIGLSRGLLSIILMILGFGAVGYLVKTTNTKYGGINGAITGALSFFILGFYSGGLYGGIGYLILGFMLGFIFAGLASIIKEGQNKL